MATLSFFDLLRNVPLFRVLSNTDLLNFADRLIIEVIPEGQIIIKEGLPGNALYIIKSGKVKIVSQLDFTHEEISLAELGEGDYFGEMALLTDEPRSASVIALGETELLRLEKDVFEELLSKEPRLYKTLGLILSQRLKETNKKRLEAEANLRKKSFSKGSFENTSLLELIRFAEDHLFTGKIRLQNMEEKAGISFKHGELTSVLLNDKANTDSLKKMLQWKTASYEVIPEVKDVHASIHSSGVELQSDNPAINAINSVAHYATGILGTSVVKNLLQETRQKLIEYYPVISEVSVMSNCTIAVNEIGLFKVNDRSLVAIAMWIRQLLCECEKIAIGFNQLNIKELTAKDENKLEKIGFYKYYQTAEELTLD